MAYDALSPVSVAVYSALHVAAFTALSTGGVGDDIAQATAFPYTWFEVEETQQFGGLGSQPGRKTLPELEVRVHIFSTYAGFKEAQAIAAKAVELLKTPPASVTGYSAWAIFHDRTVPLSEQVLNGVQVRELVLFFRLYVEET